MDDIVTRLRRRAIELEATPSYGWTRNIIGELGEAADEIMLLQTQLDAALTAYQSTEESTYGYRD